jgi:ATP/maltotriose-dependent transcriptional regulator MalT/DNA-binding SARP family transcriptional activator
LLDKLHENSHRKLILVAAAAGYGKTALLADYARDTEQAVAWLRLDEVDRDPVTLLADVLSALRVIFPAWESHVPQLAAQPGIQPANLARALRHEMADYADEYFALVLDDFHLVDDVPAITGFFDELLADLPEQAHLIVTGRTRPNLRLPRLIAQQQVAGLSEEHLRFTPAEVTELLALRRLDQLPPNAASQLLNDSEGWITGILLSTHLLQQNVPAALMGGHPPAGVLFDFLADEVLDQQPPALREFLLEAAVMPEMEPPVVDAVLERTDSGDLLAQAEQRRLFLTAVGDDARAYQFHHLFRDFLLARLGAERPARLRQVQASAARWFAGNHMPEAAVTYFLQAGDLAEAAALTEAHARDLFTSGRTATLLHWARQLAPAAEAAPRLYLHVASVEIDAGAFDRAVQPLAIAAAGFARRHDAVGLLEVTLRRTFSLIGQGQFQPALALAEQAVAEAQALREVAAQALALRYVGRCEQSLGNLVRAEQALQAAADTLEHTEHRYNLALILIDLSHVFRLRGKTTQSARTQQQALVLLRALSAMGPVADLLNNIGWDQHMLGQYEAAMGTFVEALQWAQRSGSRYSQMMVLASQADLLADLGDRAQAAELYQRARGLGEQIPNWPMVVYLDTALARQERWNGNPLAALELLRRAAATQQQHNLTLPQVDLEGQRGMALVELGRVSEGLVVLHKTTQDLEQAGTPTYLAQGLLFRAYAEFRNGQPAHAAETLGQALGVAERMGYEQMLLSEVPRTRPLLESSRGHPEIGGQVRALLARADAIHAARARLAERGLVSAGADVLAAPAPALEVCALGPVRILRDGVEIPAKAWRSARPRELFLYLIDRMPVARDKVLAAFWPDMPPARAVANLYQSLYLLRRALGLDLVVLEEQACRLAPGLELRYDAAQFEAQARTALAYRRNETRRLGALAAAAALYGGDFLADLPADWAVQRQHDLSALHQRVLTEYADELLHLTRYEEARQVLTRALVAEPYRDDVHGMLLMCLAAIGRRYEVVAHYQRYREALRNDLGLDPPAEVRALYARLIE